MSVIKGNHGGLGGSGAPGGALGSFFSQTIDQSLRLDNASGAYLEIAAAPPTATNLKKTTISCWVKRSGLSSEVNTVFWATVNGLMLQFFAADNIYIYDNGAGGWQSTVTNGGRIFRDPSAWYHLALIIDTTQSTAADRAKFYINGELQTLNSYPGQNTDITWHNQSTQRIGNPNDTTDLAGYIAEFISIDGQDVAISDLGETKDGVWIPKDVSGLTVGNAGYYLPFAQDTSSGASGFFNRSGVTYLSYSDATDYDIGSSDDFTIEAFIRPTSTMMSNYCYMLGYYGGPSGPYMLLQFSPSSNLFYFYTGNGAGYSFSYTSGDIVANQWHHVVVNRNSGNLEMFLDGSRIGSTQSSNTVSWNNDRFNIGMAGGGSSTYAFDGYISNVRFVVGSAVYSAGSSITVPTSTLTAVTNTKLLALTTTTLTADASSNNVTATAYGSGYFSSTLSPFASFNFFSDTSGNANHFTANNLFVSDVVPDSPTNNFATMNPVYHSSLQAALLRGNLQCDTAGFNNSAHNYGAVSTFAIPKDKKIYIEVECTDGVGSNWYAGFATQSGLESGTSSTNVGGASAVTLYNRAVMKNGTQFQYSSSSGLGGLGGGTSPLQAGDILGMAVDGSNGNVWFHKNGSYFHEILGNNGSTGNAGDPSSNSYPVATVDNVPAEDLFVVIGGNTSVSSIFVNFGQDSQNVASANADSEGIGTFEYAVPTGFVCLCSSNLTDPEIGPTKSSQADDNFNTVLYTGNASSRSITGVGFQPDWVWLKPRSDADNHVVFDSVRGVQKFLYVNGTGAEGTRSGDGLSSFDSDGFSIGDWNNINESSQTYVAWNWKAGGSASSNSDGSTTSSVSANTDAGFSILTYTADAATGTVGHGLNSAPELVIGRPRSDTNWYVMHTPGGVVPANNILNLDSSVAAFNPGANHFNDTYPTNTVVSYGGYMGNDLSNDDKLMYCFHSVEGHSKVGSYVGNGAADGAFVYTGFRPAWLMVKRSSGSGGWHLFDNKRSTFNEIDVRLEADNTDAENTSGPPHMDFLSNGFKMRTTFDNMNASGSTYIYLAFAEDPFKFANAR